MPYTAQKLITKAYYLSGIVSRKMQTPTGEQISDGLELLNMILATKAYDKSFIPYFSEKEITAVIGQEKYYIENLVEIESFTFNIGDVRFPATQVGRKNYFATARADNINSLPFKWHAERVLDGTDLYLYFIPYDNFKMRVWGKFAFDDVALNDDLLEVYDSYYINYLKYELAMYICNEYNIMVQPQIAANLEQIRNKIRDQSLPDLTITKKSRFGSAIGSMWGWASLGRGWSIDG